MSESDVSAAASRGLKLAVCAAIVLAMLGVILGGYAAVRLARIDRQCADLVRSRDELESGMTDNADECNYLAGKDELAMRLLTELSAKYDVLAAQQKALAYAQEEMGRDKTIRLTNGGFEEKRADGGPASWGHRNYRGQHEGPATKPVIDTEVKRTGNSSLRIDHIQVGQYTYLFQSHSPRTGPALKPNTDYLYSGYFRLEKVTQDPTGSGGIKPLALSGGHMPFVYGNGPDYSLNGEWQKLEVRFNTGYREPVYRGLMSVSYTHLTLPTILLV